MRVLVLTPYPYGTTAGPRSSFELWERVLSEADISLDYAVFETARLHEILYQRGRVAGKALEVGRSYVKFIPKVRDVREYDAVLVNREATLIGPALIERWVARQRRPLISTATWFLIVDQSRQSSNTATWQTGLYYVNGRRKPGFEAFRFPFIVKRASKQPPQVWAVSPESGMLRVQAREGRGWTTILRTRVRAHGVIDRTIAVSGRPTLRAVIGSDVSLGWRS